MTQSVQLVDLKLEFKFSTAKAFLVELPDGEEVWLQRSVVERNTDGTFTMPKSYAKEKGLL